MPRGMVAAAAAATLVACWAPGQAQASARALIFTCKYDANVRSSPYTGQSNVVNICYTGTRIYPMCWVIGGSVNGDNRWYAWIRNGDPEYVHYSQVKSEGAGGLIKMHLGCPSECS